MNVLVTGGAGFIGSHLVEHFQGIARVRVLDNLRSGSRENLLGLEHEFTEGSILDRAAVRAAVHGMDYVFHLAAMVSVPESMADPVGCTEVNTIGTLIVLEEAARAGVKKLCFSGTAAVYGNNPALPKEEEMTPEPESPYAISKLDGEHYARLFTASGRLPTVCLRYFNVFGPRQTPESGYAAAVPIFIHRALQGEPLTIYGDGGQTRDFIHVRDVAAANAFFATQSPATGVFNIAHGGSLSISSLAAQIIHATPSASKLVFAERRPGDIRHSTASIQKMTRAGFTPRVAFQDGLRETIAATRAAFQAREEAKTASSLARES